MLVFTTVPSTTSLTSSSILTKDPTNLPSTNPPILNNLATSLKVVRDFSKDMLDNTSESFRKFANDFENEIERAYEVEQKFERTTVIRLRNGSINVTFIVFFKSGISPANACAPLEKAIKEDGKLGNFEIIPGSLECSKPNRKYFGHV
ncbi:adhesion G-protein coupled receptor F1-like [Actinia tenebrosa]|uniref:Adhesion G-protein coupled receptor F1-like n=1 Tax=Actinia tenebrosa TaxID=6105 RepID=A0A6P8HCD4_ACTTE|nr:adhesion G-protein coupled receptor F1-like [Actinia tenebrosa]